MAERVVVVRKARVRFSPSTLKKMLEEENKDKKRLKVSISIGIALIVMSVIVIIFFEFNIATRAIMEDEQFQPNPYIMFGLIGLVVLTIVVIRFRKKILRRNGNGG